jgi:nickel-dependent lactate racemase
VPASRREGITHPDCIGLHRRPRRSKSWRSSAKGRRAIIAVVTTTPARSGFTSPPGIDRLGTPVHRRALCRADLYITLGFIEPHLMLDIPAGANSIAPGLAAQKPFACCTAPGFHA